MENLKAYLFTDMEYGIILFELNQWVSWADKDRTMYTKYIGFNASLLEDECRINEWGNLHECRKVITNVVNGSYTDEELLNILPVSALSTTAENSVRLASGTSDGYFKLKDIADIAVRDSMLTAIRRAIIDIML